MICAPPGSTRRPADVVLQASEAAGLHLRPPEPSGAFRPKRDECPPRTGPLALQPPPADGVGWASWTCAALPLSSVSPSPQSDPPPAAGGAPPPPPPSTAGRSPGTISN